MKRRTILLFAMTVLIGGACRTSGGAVVAGEIRPINHAENRGTAILNLFDENNQGYIIKAKPGEITIKQILSGTYCYTIDCPKRTRVSGGGFVASNDEVFQKVVINDKRGVSLTVPKLR